MIIAQISDTHIALDADNAEKRIEEFAATIDHINSLETQPDVIVHTGDVAHNGTLEEYSLAREILASAKSPSYILAGNRDNRQNLKACFANLGYLNDASSFIEYSIDDFPVKLVMLDSVSLDSNKGDYCSKRFDALEALMATNDAKSAVVFIHHPPFMATQCPDPMQFSSDKVLEELRNALSGFKYIAAVFCGHVHRFDCGRIGEIQASAMTSTVTQLRWGNYPPEMADRPLYQLHRLGTNSDVTSSTQIVHS